ncbi:MAG: hypothetical protein SVU69_11180, partial [Pseudomonadota bacterium]|nr:hypothetical protein [Pseudomonadota bacterium]
IVRWGAKRLSPGFSVRNTHSRRHIYHDPFLRAMPRFANCRDMSRLTCMGIGSTVGDGPFRWSFAPVNDDLPRHTS